MRNRIPTADRYWAKVDTSAGPDACWPWMASCNGDGYGSFWDGTYRPGGNPNNVRAHRWGCELHLGRRLSPAECVCHRCDNPRCQNPAHWFIGSHADNAADRQQKGRGGPGGVPSPGESNGSAKLTEQDVLLIRSRYADGQSQSSLARTFGVSQPLISAVVHRKLWQHI